MGLTPSASRIQHPIHVASTAGKLNQRAEEVSMTIQRLRSRVYGILHTSFGIFSSVGTLRTPVREAFSYGIQHISLWFNEVWPYASLNHNDTELSICTTDGSYDGKTPNVASSPRRLSGPLRVVALGGPTEDKFDACAHEWNCYLTVAESIRRQIESSPMIYAVSRMKMPHVRQSAASLMWFTEPRAMVSLIWSRLGHSSVTHSGKYTVLGQFLWDHNLQVGLLTAWSIIF